jgi:hypothetical protein
MVAELLRLTYNPTIPLNSCFERTNLQGAVEP